MAAAVVGSVITFTDMVMDDGGFTLSTDTTAAFGGSGASDNGATDIESADIVTDFLSGTDVIDFTNLGGGLGMYAEGAAVADFATARDRRGHGVRWHGDVLPDLDHDGRCAAPST